MERILEQGKPNYLDYMGYSEKTGYVFGTSIIKDNSNGELNVAENQIENGQVSFNKNDASLNGNIYWLSKYKSH